MTERLNYVEISLSDNPMDEVGPFGMPLNALPQKCPHCTFPDLDHLAQPYLLGKGITRPVEIDVAEVGNFFVKDRARKVIEIACPGQCEFHPTFDKKTKEQTPWSLAVPTWTIPIGTVKAKIPRCPVCGEPRVAHWGSHYDQTLPETIESDIAKSSEWISYESTGEEANWYYMNVLKLKRPPETPTHRWTRLKLARWLYFSVRLEQLLKALGIKGVVRSYSSKAKPTEADMAWVEEQIKVLKRHGVSKAAPVANTKKVTTWFRGYLKKHAKQQAIEPDFTTIEALLGKSLPSSYKAFLSKVGPTTFRDVDDEQGFDASILGPGDMDTTEYRRGVLQVEDEDSARIDGISFATTGHGDCFCFDLGGPEPELPVYLYDHEKNCFEPYASSFESCLKRFVTG
jgi:hypothetical protein